MLLNKAISLYRFIIFIFFLIFFCPLGVFSITNPKDELKSVGVFTKLGAKIDMTLTFYDENGNKGKLSDFILPNRPFIIVPVYYTCPRLCGLVLGGTASLINKLNLTLGKDYSLLAVSFDPGDTPKTAIRKKEQFATNIKDSNFWRFLTSNNAKDIHSLMESIGFKYKKDSGEFAHSAAIFVITANGVISQFFTGIDYDPKDVRLSLVDASKGRIGNVIDHVLLFCYRFDPTKGKYTLAAYNFIRVGGALTLILLGFFIVKLFKKSSK